MIFFQVNNKIQSCCDIFLGRVDLSTHLWQSNNPIYFKGVMVVFGPGCNSWRKKKPKNLQLTWNACRICVCVCVCVCVSMCACSVVCGLVTPWTVVAHQAPLSIGFSRQEYWSELPFPSPGDLPNLGIEPKSLASPALAGRFFAANATWEYICICINMEEAMAPHSSTLAWKIPWTEEPGGLQSMGSRRIGHDWADFTFTFHFHALEKEMEPTLVFLPGESQGQQSLVGCRLWGRTESDTTEVT